MSFLGEIKRRKVFQVAAVYAVVAWLIIQIVGEVSEPLNLPDWLDTVVIVLLAVGFPIAVILAWAFDVTPEGVVRDQGTAVAAASGRRIEYVLIGLVVVALTWVIYRVEFDSGSVPDSQVDGRLPNSVAVLPFENLSPDPDNAYFAAGIHESTLNQLAKIRAFTVMAHTSVMQYAEDPPPITEIAEALNVEMVMEGSVRYADGRVRIAAQLIDGRTGAHRWSDEFDRDLTDIFSVQAEIAENIAVALEAELLPDERQRIQTVQTRSSDALTLYLQASNINVGPNGVGPQVDLHQLLDQAIQLDPSFARAHALKAHDYAYAMIRSRLHDGPQVSELEQLAFEHAGRAQSLDYEENLAYVALANIARFNWRATEAQAAFERALELAPNDLPRMTSFVHFLAYLEEYERSIELAQRVVELDPSNPSLAYAYLYAGDFESAYIAWTNLLHFDIHKTASAVYRSLAIVEWHRDNKESAIINIKAAERLLTKNPVDYAEQIQVYGMLGLKDDADRLFRIFEQMADTFHIPAFTWVLAYTGIGEYEKALTLLNRIDVERSPEDSLDSFQFAINRRHDPVFEQPEFVEMRDKLRLKR